MVSDPVESSGVASPCTSVCQLNSDRVCVGCGRTLDEIAEWSEAGEGRRREIRATASQRLARIRPSLEQSPE